MIKNKNGEYKVPFCNVYCVGFKNWIKECIWIFGVRKIFPYVHDYYETDSMLNYYMENPKGLYEQHEFQIKAALKNRNEKINNN